MIAFLLLLWGCAPERPAPDTATVFTDDLGRRVAIPQEVRRVLTLAPNLTELVYAAGAGPRLAAASLADDYPAALDTLPRFSVLPLDVEAVVALQPDLILATDVNTVEDAKPFEALGIPVVFLSFPRIEDVFRNLRTIGTLLGHADTADATADTLEARLERLRRKTADVPERPTVLFLAGDDPLFAFGNESFVHDLADAAGGTSSTAHFDTPTPVLSEEFVLKARPDVIIGAGNAAFSLARLRARYPTWSLVPAVAQERVYAMDGALVYRPGPRLVDGAYHLAALLHPSLFPASSSPSSPSPMP